MAARFTISQIHSFKSSIIRYFWMRMSNWFGNDHDYLIRCDLLGNESSAESHKRYTDLDWGVIFDPPEVLPEGLKLQL